MAEIDMERRRRRRAWPWLVALLLLVALAVGAWLVFAGGTSNFETAPAAETQAVPEPNPAPPPMQDTAATTPGRQPSGY